MKILAKAGLICTTLLLLLTSACGEPGKKYDLIKISTGKGDMYIWLYDQTPLHKENFLKLTREGYYDKTQFHRIIQSFMIQGGDPNTREKNRMMWGMGGPDYTIPAEIRPELYHKKGALAAARQGDQINPKRESAGSQFYIVQGMVMSNEEMDFIEEQIRFANNDSTFKFSEDARKDYSTIGGAASLDMQYTVFGQVIGGLEVIDKIAGIQTEMQDRPVEEIIMDIDVIQMSANQLKKKFNFEVPAEK